MTILEHSYAPEVESRSTQYAHPGKRPQINLFIFSNVDLLDMSINKPLSWPMDYFSPAGGEVMSDPFLPLTPDRKSKHISSIYPQIHAFLVLYTTSSIGSVEETINVFDMDFGAAIDSTNSFPELEHSSHESRHIHFQVSESASSSRLYSSMPVRRPSRRSPVRTLSPHSETGFYSDHRRKFLCLLPGCERRFTSQYTLKVHMEAHKPKPKVSYPCTHGCSERFSRQHDRLRHEVAKHGKVCEFSCEACGRFFSSSKTLGNHKCPLAQEGTRWVNS